MYMYRSSVCSTDIEGKTVAFSLSSYLLLFNTYNTDLLVKALPRCRGYVTAHCLIRAYILLGDYCLARQFLRYLALAVRVPDLSVWPP